MEHKMIGEAGYCYKLAARSSNNSLIKEKLGNLAYFTEDYDEALKYYESCLGRHKNYAINCKIGNIKMLKRQYE